MTARSDIATNERAGCVGGPHIAGTDKECIYCDHHRVLWGLFWLAEEIDNAADAIGPAPDLAERNLRHYARMARALRDGCDPRPFSSRVCSRGTFTCEANHV